MARTFRLIVCLAALLWLVFVVRLSRDVDIPRPAALGPFVGPPVGPRKEGLGIGPRRGPRTVPRSIRPVITLDEGTAGQEMQRLRDHWQRAVLLR